MPWDRFEPLAKGVLREDGYIAPPYVIDAHTHVHLHIPKPGKTRFKDFNEVSEQLMLKEKAGFIDPKSLIREMDRYGVNKACVLYAGRMCIDFEHYLNILRAEPDRFIGFYWPQEEAVETSPGQWPALTPERMAELAEKALSYPEIRGLGEGTIAEACHFAERKGWPAEDIVRFYMPMLEVAASKKAPIIMHSGPAPYNIRITPSIRKMFYRGYVVMRNFDPMVYDEMITLFPEIPFIIAHCGVQGCHFYGSYADHALILASMHENVYLETSMAPADLIEKAIADPSIGAEKLVLGSDFGATSSYYVYKGQVLPSYKKRPFPELPGMHIEQSIRVLDQVTMCPEERRLIMGQNMARLLGLD
jgi:predicted TIM-barrel fold metal-dependent hydrolase